MLNKCSSRFGFLLLATLVVAFGLFSFFSQQQEQQQEQQHAAAPLPTGQRGSWNMLFDDEFNGTELDLTKWRPNWFGKNDTAITAPVSIKEEQCVDPQQSSVSNGELDLKAIQSSCTVNGKTYNYRSGLVSSDGHFNFTYGYMEARMWTPGDSTITDWPAFWASGKNWPQEGEIDVMEGLGGKPCWHFHYAGGDPGECVNMSNPGTGWHTYAADWEPGMITYFYDGAEVGQITSGVTSSPMYVALSLGLSNVASPPITVPAIARIDYVRVWQKQ